MAMRGKAIGHGGALDVLEPASKPAGQDCCRAFRVSTLEARVNRMEGASLAPAIHTRDTQRRVAKCAAGSVGDLLFANAPNPAHSTRRSRLAKGSELGHEARLGLQREGPGVRKVAIIGLAGLVAACGGGQDESAAQADRDPVVADAVQDPILADPDLASQNRGSAALTSGGPATAPIPPINKQPEEVERARTAAATLLGGKVDPAPGPASTAERSALDGAVTPLAALGAAGLGSASCEKSFAFSATWAAKLPAALQVYPRGHTMVAGGADATDCKVRSVRFVTPVPVNDVIDFYFAMAAKAKLNPQRAREGSDEVVRGGTPASGYAVYVRARADGVSEVDLVTRGL